jgi:hypothetical protein
MSRAVSSWCLNKRWSPPLWPPTLTAVLSVLYVVFQVYYYYYYLLLLLFIKLKMCRSNKDVD